MAIAKMEKRSSTVWNRSSLITVGIGGVLAFISLILLWSAFKNFMVRTSYVEAAFNYDSNRRPSVKSYAERARSWGSHAESAELLAKVHVEANQLDAAEKLYAQMATGKRRAMGLCGQGIVLIRRADAEKNPKTFLELAKKAKDRFSEAKAEDARLVEAQIGGATADLLVGVKTNAPEKIAAARTEFSKILKSLQGSEETAGQVTREGFMDLYVGLSRSFASPEKYSPQALEYAGSARRYLPSSVGLYAVELALQAQQMAESPPAAEEIRAAKMYERLKKLNERIVSTKSMEPVADSWFALTVATASALARGGKPEDVTSSKEMLNLAQSARGQDTVFAEILEASILMEAALKPARNWNERQTNYSHAQRQIMNVLQMKEIQDASRAQLRATLLNNQAFFEEDTAAQSPSEQRYEQVVSLLKRALEADVQAGLPDGSYEVRRNLAVIQKRRNKPDAAEHFLAAQKAAVGRTEETLRRDLDELIKYFGN